MPRRSPPRSRCPARTAPVNHLTTPRYLSKRCVVAYLMLEQLPDRPLGERDIVPLLQVHPQTPLSKAGFLFGLFQEPYR